MNKARARVIAFNRFKNFTLFTPFHNNKCWVWVSLNYRLIICLGVYIHLFSGRFPRRACALLGMTVGAGSGRMVKQSIYYRLTKVTADNSYHFFSDFLLRKGTLQAMDSMRSSFFPLGDGLPRPLSEVVNCVLRAALQQSRS